MFVLNILIILGRNALRCNRQTMLFLSLTGVDANFLPVALTSVF